ncbi:MAG: hypothetical protein AB8G11_09540 [Saprospiraceae bacterium]
MKPSNIQYLFSTLIKAFGLIVFVCVFSINVNAQPEDKKNQKSDITEKSGVALDFMEEVSEEEINILKTFLHTNQEAFSITIYDFKDEKVQVFIYNSKTNERLYSLNVEPKEDICNVELLTKPLQKGTYHVVVKGESRVIPKQMIID